MRTFFASRHTRLFVGLGALLLLLGLGISSIYHNYWVIPHRHLASVKLGDLTPKERQELRNTIRQTFMQALGVLGGVIGGAALLGGLYFTARTLRTSQETLRVNQEALRVTQEGQITERFGKAIEHLGDTRLTVRLGGIYALERIARDSPKDHWQIMEVLTAYVRDNARWLPESTPTLLAPAPDLSPQLGTGIQAVLTVLGRRLRSSEREREHRLDLAQTDLRGASLHEAHLEGVSLFEAHLEDASLYKAHLEGATLYEAHLERTVLIDAHLEGAILNKAHLEGALLDEAHLEGASGLIIEQLLTAASLKGVVLDPPLMEQLQREHPELLEWV